MQSFRIAYFRRYKQLRVMIDERLPHESFTLYSIVTEVISKLVKISLIWIIKVVRST